MNYLFQQVTVLLASLKLKQLFLIFLIIFPPSRVNNKTRHLCLLKLYFVAPPKIRKINLSNFHNSFLMRAWASAELYISDTNLWPRSETVWLLILSIINNCNILQAIYIQIANVLVVAERHQKNCLLELWKTSSLSNMRLEFYQLLRCFNLTQLILSAWDFYVTEILDWSQ